MKMKEVPTMTTTVHFHGDNDVHPMDYENLVSSNQKIDNVSSINSECSRCNGKNGYDSDDSGSKHTCSVPMKFDSSYHVHSAGAGVCHDMIACQKMCKCLAFIHIPKLFCSSDTTSKIICIIKSIMRNISIVPTGMDYTSHGHWVLNEYPTIEVYRKKKGIDAIIVVTSPPSAIHVRAFTSMMQRIYDLQSNKCTRPFCLSDIVKSQEYADMKRSSYENACSMLYAIVCEMKINVQLQRRLIGNPEMERSCDSDPCEYMVVPDSYQFINVYSKTNIHVIAGGSDTIRGDYDHTNCNNNSGTPMQRVDDMKYYNISCNTRFNQLSQLAIASVFNAETQNKSIEKSKKDIGVQKMMNIMQSGLVTIDDSMKMIKSSDNHIPNEEKKTEYLMTCATKNQGDQEAILEKLNGFLEQLHLSTGMNKDSTDDKYNVLVNQIKSNLMKEFSQNSKKYIDGLFVEGGSVNDNQIKSNPIDSASVFNHFTGDKSLFEFITEKCSNMIDSIMPTDEMNYMLDSNAKTLKKNIMSNATAIRNYVPSITEDTFNCFNAKGTKSVFDKDPSVNHDGVVVYNSGCVPIRKYELDCTLANNEGMSKKNLFESKDPDMQFYRKKTNMTNDINSTNVYDHEIVYYQPDGKKKYLCLLEFKLNDVDWNTKWKCGRPSIISLHINKEEMKNLKKMGVECEKYEPISNESTDFMEPYNLCKIISDTVDWKKDTMELKKESNDKINNNTNTTPVVTKSETRSFELKNNNVGHEQLIELLKLMKQQ
jgi:hypothetical protein